MRSATDLALLRRTRDDAGTTFRIIMAMVLPSPVNHRFAASRLGLLGLRQPAGSGRARREEGWTGLSSGASTPSTRRLGASLSTGGGALPVSPSCKGELVQLALAVPCLLREARCVGPDSVIHDESVSRPVRLRWHPSERARPFHASAAWRPRGCARCHACPRRSDASSASP